MTVVMHKREDSGPGTNMGGGAVCKISNQGLSLLACLTIAFHFQEDDEAGDF